MVLIKTNRYVEKVTEKGVVQSRQGGLGSGVLIEDGFILTASHVVHIADRIEVKTVDGKIYPARTVGSIPLADLAVIRLITPLKNMPTAKIGDSDAIDIGAEVFIVGAPYGLTQTLTVGHLSGRRTSEDSTALIQTEFLQTDAPINRGNSGGPMFNTKGEVVGIVSHIRSFSGGSEGLGFAASINMVKRLLLDNPPVWTGMEFVPMSKTLADAINVPFPNGILVQQVAYGSMGDRFGLQPGRISAVIAGQNLLLGGDVIIGIGGEEVSATPDGMRRARRYAKSLKEGDTMEITVYRNGSKVQLTASKPDPTTL
ncbi:S1C family serine protease [Exilibacterium tricleocarpae]|uniref:S1C family serine protease n=1 Tax=Exilibacterium tricleocarpae TaxID=2591008 RepID=UPI0015D1E7F1|nr:trypsin-like peptidase domain-containing protein [Exilibacterium tricleocarpae]